MVKENAEQIIKRLQREVSKITNKYLQPASERHLGIMTPEDKIDLSHALGYREWIEEPISIFDLGVGRYVGYVYNLLDGPYQNTDTSDKTVLMIDVTVDVPPRKQFVVHWSGVGRVYYQNIHHNKNGNPQAWQRIVKEVSLWNGTAEYAGQTITLNESLAHYNRIKIKYNAQSLNKYFEFDIPGTNANISLRDFNLSDGTASWLAVYETRLQKVDDTTFQVLSTTNKLIGQTGNIVNDTNQIVITEIIGIQ